ncbi:hypothetical protein CW304_29970 [Bacillus sp. UFRGS-B20]|nr:hypothetical protein CW304_29970 [Bacillus sp. UFRGS-B20]
MLLNIVSCRTVGWLLTYCFHNSRYAFYRTSFYSLWLKSKSHSLAFFNAFFQTPWEILFLNIPWRRQNSTFCTTFTYRINMTWFFPD